MESKKNLKTVDLLNWVGKVFIGNRKHIDIIQTISELSKNTGLYFLLGKDIQTEESHKNFGKRNTINGMTKKTD